MKQNMKLIISTLSALLFTGAYLSAQMPGMMTMQPSAPEGTALGANTTSGAAGIALGNRVVMRGFVDFVYNYDTKSNPEKIRLLIKPKMAKMFLTLIPLLI